MNRWQCRQPGCDRAVTGCGGAVGLRAIGWYFEPGPMIFCPEHRPDVDPQDCSICTSEVYAFHFQSLVLGQPAHLPALALEHAKHLAQREE